MNSPFVVVGAGVGGLASAAYLAQRGEKVLVLEARSKAGGLAAGLELEGLQFDAGPYVLLDRPGLEWAFRQFGQELSSHVKLRKPVKVYQVEMEEGPTVRIFSDLETTVAGIEKAWPGAGANYRLFISRMAKIYESLRPLQYRSRVGPWALLSSGAWRQIPFLMSSLADVLRRAELPEPLVDALSIWTHVAGQKASEAPAPMAFVPALIHTHGAYVPEGGLSTIPAALEKIARSAGAEFRYGCRVDALHPSGDSWIVEAGGERIAAHRVVSNVGISTYLKLFNGIPSRFRNNLSRLPLQSPGVCAYLAVRGEEHSSFLRFRLPREGLCRLFILPGAVDPQLSGTARLLGPVSHDWAQQAGAQGQREYLEKILEESWWKQGLSETRILARRTPVEWGAEYSLYRDSMNPVMTARFMRQGRLAHKSPVKNGLYLAGSSTHPGQWISFCAISGILAAQEALC